jgi:dihydroxyacetone kinase
MQKPINHKQFEVLTADYFAQKAKNAKGKEKMLVALEMSKYLTLAREHGLSLEELEKAGFKFATVPDIKN